MSKAFIRAIALLCVLALLPTLAACQSGEQSGETQEGEIVYHTLSFNTNGGTPIASMQIRDGRKATKPEDPVLENYIFHHWQLPDGRTWFFDSKSVTEDTTLTAIWIKAEDLFDLAPMPEGDGIMITSINMQEEFSLLKIPSVINGKKVEGIGAAAFKLIHERYATNILFPETLKYVEEEAFMSITEVTLTFQSTFTYIGESAFEGATNVSQITLGEGMDSIPFRAFMNCASLKSLDIPEGVTVIEENAFELCSSLVKIVMPSTLTTVESCAFKDCDALKAVFFRGTEEQFDALDISVENDVLKDVKVYYYTEEQPSEEGEFWHYDKNGSPVLW